MDAKKGCVLGKSKLDMDFDCVVVGTCHPHVDQGSMVITAAIFFAD